MSVSGQLKLCKNGWAHLSVWEGARTEPPPWPLHRNTKKRGLFRKAQTHVVPEDDPPDGAVDEVSVEVFGEDGDEEEDVMELLGAADGCWQLESAAEEAEAKGQRISSPSTVAPSARDEAAADVAVLRRLVSLNLVAPIAPAEVRRRASYERLNAFGCFVHRRPSEAERGLHVTERTEYPACWWIRYRHQFPVVGLVVSFRFLGSG